MSLVLLIHNPLINLVDRELCYFFPTPSGACPVISHLQLLQGKVPVFRTLTAVADKLGTVFMIRLGMQRTVVVSDNVTVKECFTTKDKIFASRPNSAAAKILGYDYALFALAPYGPLWREMRKISILELLSTVASLTPPM